MVESFLAMKASLEKEKLSYQKIWASREQDLTRVLESISTMYGDLHSLIGASLPRIATLELPDASSDQPLKTDVFDA